MLGSARTFCCTVREALGLVFASPEYLAWMDLTPAPNWFVTSVAFPAVATDTPSIVLAPS